MSDIFATLHVCAARRGRAFYTEEQAITIEFDQTPNDFTTFFLHESRQLPAARRSLQLWRFGVPTVWLVIAALGVLADGITPVFWILTTASLLWIAASPFVWTWVVRRRSTQAYATQCSRGCIGPHRLTLLRDGVLDATPYYEWKIFWTGIDKLVCTESHCFLYTGLHSALPVPREAFPDSQRLEGFSVALRELKQQALNMK